MSEKLRAAAQRDKRHSCTLQHEPSGEFTGCGQSVPSLRLANGRLFSEA
jgi:hypothetical protein